MDGKAKGQTGRPAVEEIVRAPNVEIHTLTDTGVFPNNNALPLLIYRGALEADAPDLVEQVRRLFADHQWDGSWVDSVYDYHHYHSTAHEVLAICGGQAEVRFGGDHGITRTVSAGDVIVIPAGIAHKRLAAGGAFVVVGAYPEGQTYDMCYGREGERPAADDNIARVPMPKSDPIYGPHGPLMEHWSAA
jgi:uncharacterized protein YjlB